MTRPKLHPSFIAGVLFGAVAMAALFAMAGFTGAPPGVLPGNPAPVSIEDAEDSTGCHYLLFARGRDIGVTARLRRDGRPDCPEVSP